MREPDLESGRDWAPEAQAPGPPEGRPLGCGAVAAAFGAGLAAAVLVAGLGALVAGESLALASLLVEVGFLAGVIAYLGVSGRRIAGALRLGPLAAPTSTYVLALKLGVALLLANFAATALLGPPLRDIEFVSQVEGTAERIALAVSVALAAPLIEESLFRGLLQGVMEDRMRPAFAIMAAALPFALLHGPEPALFFFFWSLPVGWMTWRTGSVRPAVLVHAVNNLVGLTGLLLRGTVRPEELERTAGTIVLSLALLTLAALWSVRLCRRVGELVGEGSREAGVGRSAREQARSAESGV